MTDPIPLEHPKRPAPRPQYLVPRLVDGGGQAEATGMDLRKFLSILRRRKGVIIGCIILITGLIAALVFQLTPRYTAEASVLLDTRKTNVVPLQNVLSGLQNDSAVVLSEVEVLSSPRIAGKVVEKLHLDTLPEFNPELAPKPIFAPVTWIKELLLPLLGKHGENGEAVTGPEAIQIEVRRQLASRVKVTNDGESYILKVRAESEDPRLAAKIANAYVDAYLLDQLEAKFEATRRASAFLSDHLGELRDKVRDSEHAVEIYKEQNHIVQAKDSTLTGTQLSEINSQLIVAQAEMAEKEAESREMQSLVSSPDQLESSDKVIAAAPAIEKLREQEAKLLAEKADLASKFKPAHPAMVAKEQQIKEMQTKMRDEAQKALKTLQAAANAARFKVNSLRKSLDDFKASATEQSKASVQLNELEREATADRTLYESFLNRFKQTTAQEDIQQADARVVAVATPPLLPSYPNKTLFLGFAGVIATIFGVSLALFLETMDNGFRTSEQIEKMLGLSTLGHVPSVAGRKPFDLVVSQPVAQFSEAVRSVRTALRYSDIDNPPKLLLVTSSLPSEGKTVMAVSIARSVARSGARSLLIDCDLRRPGVAKILGVKPSAVPGLIDFFDGGAPIESVIQVDRESGMHFIATKGGTANPQDLLSSQQMRGMLEQMRMRYDFICIDSPPVLAVSDPIILSHMVDSTIFCIRWERTPRQVVEGALKLIRANGGAIAGAVLTRVNTRRHAAYGYGDTAYYYGRYSTYYKQS
jgi:polysaccharide biosynthesis transport protein